MSSVKLDWIDAEMDLEDALMDRPQLFRVGDRTFRLYYPTLGMSMLANRTLPVASLIKGTEFVDAAILGLCMDKPMEAVRFVAIHTIRGKSRLIDGHSIDDRTTQLTSLLNVEDTATLIKAILRLSDADRLLCHIGIGEDTQRLRQISEIRDDGTTITFGGRSIYGRLVSLACERYGWTPEYVVWEINLVSLRMMMADHITTVHLSTDEVEKLRIDNGRDFINGDNPDNARLIKEMLQDGN